jgi:hypothetical protein
VKSIQGKTEFTRSIGFRGSVRSVQSGWGGCPKKNNFDRVRSFVRGLAQGSLTGLGPGEKKRYFEACANKVGSIPVKFEEFVVFPKGKGERREEYLSVLHVIVINSLVPNPRTSSLENKRITRAKSTSLQVGCCFPLASRALGGLSRRG